MENTNDINLKEPQYTCTEANGTPVVIKGPDVYPDWMSTEDHNAMIAEWESRGTVYRIEGSFNFHKSSVIKAI